MPTYSFVPPETPTQHPAISLVDENGVIIVPGGVGAGVTSVNGETGAVDLTGTLVETALWERGGPATPELISSITHADIDQPRGMWVQGGLAYIACNQQLVIVDYSDTDNLRVIGKAVDATALLGAREVWVSGNLAFVTADNTGSDGSVVVVDVTDPSAPVVLSSVTTTDLDSAHGLQLQGHKLYVAASLANLVTVWDVGIPNRPPVKLAQISVPSPNRLTIRNNVLFVSLSGIGSTGGLAIIDLRTLTPVLLQHADLAGARGIVVDGTYVYLACTPLDLVSVIDISNLSAPTIATSLVDAVNLDGAREMTKVGSTLFVACANSNNLAVLDASHPPALTLTGTLATAETAGANGLRVIEHHNEGIAFVTGTSAGLALLRTVWRRQAPGTVAAEYVEASNALGVGTGGVRSSGPVVTPDAVVTSTLEHKGDRVGFNGATAQLPLLAVAATGASSVETFDPATVTTEELAMRFNALWTYLLARGDSRPRGYALGDLGVTGRAAETPYTADLDLGAATWSLRFKIVHATWANPAAISYVLSKANDDATTVSYEVRINTIGDLAVNGRPLGGGAELLRTWVGFLATCTPGESRDIGVVIDNFTGGTRRARFYNNDGTEAAPVWTLAATSTPPGAVPAEPQVGALPLRLGARRSTFVGAWDGKILLVEVRNGDLTTEPVLRFDASKVAVAAASPFVMPDGRVWTLKGGASVVAA